MCCIQNLWYSSLPVSPRKTEKPFPSAFKSRQALQAIFFNLQWKCVDVPVSPISKSTPLVSAAPFFFEEYIIPQVRINKMLNKTYCWLPPKSFRIQWYILTYFCGLLRGLSPEYFLNFFSNLYILPWLHKSCKFMVLRLLANTFVSQTIKFVHFYSCPQANLSPRFLSSPQVEVNYPFLLNSIFWKSFFSNRKGGENYGVEKMPKLHLQGYW